MAYDGAQAARWQDAVRQLSFGEPELEKKLQSLLTIEGGGATLERIINDIMTYQSQNNTEGAQAINDWLSNYINSPEFDRAGFADAYSTHRGDQAQAERAAVPLDDLIDMYEGVEGADDILGALNPYPSLQMSDVQLTDEQQTMLGRAQTLDAERGTNLSERLQDMYMQGHVASGAPAGPRPTAPSFGPRAPSAPQVMPRIASLQTHGAPASPFTAPAFGPSRPHPKTPGPQPTFERPPVRTSKASTSEAPGKMLYAEALSRRKKRNPNGL